MLPLPVLHKFSNALNMSQSGGADYAQPLANIYRDYAPVFLQGPFLKRN